MSIDWSAPPPAYESLQQSDTTTKISDRIQTTAHTESSISNDEFAEVARLRNFLSYCIAVDYRCHAPNKLTAEDRDHYLDLANVALARRRAGSGDRVLAPYLRKHLYIPSYRLRISTDISQAVLVRFARHRSPYFGRYEGCETGICQQFGMRVLAKKLWIDRQLLIPRLGLSEPTCLELNQALLRMARLYFISIDGTDSSGSVLMSSSGRDEDEATFKCVLNQHRRHCDDNRLVKVTLRQRGYQFIVHGISRLLRLDLYPRSRLPIFPDGCSG